ncbi:MAG TPA: NRDE family protein [Rhodanobacteraceae bacterium]
MCLIAAAWKTHPRWRLVLLGNRDEAHARPAAPLARWSDAPHILAGRDLQAGGTWMGVADDGRAAVVTNVRDPVAGKDGASRGLLISDYLRGDAGAGFYARGLRDGPVHYRPFNLLLFDHDEAMYLGNHPDARLQPVKPGVHGLSNADFDTPWPKTEALAEHLSDWVKRGKADDFEPLFAALADDSPWPDDVLPDTGVGIALERQLSAAFIRGHAFGTRASTVIAIDHAGAGCIIERRFGADGKPQGQSRLELTPSSLP